MAHFVWFMCMLALVVSLLRRGRLWTPGILRDPFSLIGGLAAGAGELGAAALAPAVDIGATAALGAIPEIAAIPEFASAAALPSLAAATSVAADFAPAASLTEGVPALAAAPETLASAGFAPSTLQGLSAAIPSTTLPPVDVSAGAAPISPTPVAPVPAPPSLQLASLDTGTISDTGAPALAATTSADTGLPASTATATTGTAGSDLSPVTGDYSGVAKDFASTTTGSQGLLSKLGLGGLEKFASENKGLFQIAGLAMPLLQNLFGGQPKLPQLNVSNQAADQAAAQAAQEANIGQGLQTASQTGTLPPGYQAAIDNAQQAAAAKIRSNYASLGLSGSSSEAEDIANSNLQIQAQAAPILQQLMSQGLSATQAGISGLTGAGQLALSQAQLQLQMDQELQDALKNLSTNLILATLPSKIGA